MPIGRSRPERPKVAPPGPGSLRREACRALFAAVIAVQGAWAAETAVAAAAAEPSPAGLLEAGRRLFDDGVRRDGRPLVGAGIAGAELQGNQAACATCHRRSGMGGREGAAAVSPVTGTALYATPVPYRPARPGRAPQQLSPLRHESRDAYDDATLARALRDGVDPNGRPLDALMPRYALNDADMAAIVAYVRQLGTVQSPGLDGGKLHLATIITPDADPLRASTVERAMVAWSRGGALGGLPIDLQVWRLQGAASGWSDQLQALYDRRPVYAVLSGAGAAEWTPVRDFCERAAVPCLFPIVDLAPEDERDRFSLYASRGVPLEARLLVSALGELDPPPRRVVQLAAGNAGRAGALVLANALATLPTITVDASAPGEAATGVPDDVSREDALVLWMGPEAVEALARRHPEGLPAGAVVLSAQLAPPERTVLPEAWRRQVRWISQRSDPARRSGKGVIGLLPWTRHLKLEGSDEAILAEVYLATYYFGDSLSRMRGHYSREYLLESLEAAHYERAAGSAFFQLSLGPGQREAAKAGHLLGYAPPAWTRLTTIGPRLSP